MNKIDLYLKYLIYNLIILTLLVCLSFGCIFGSKEKTPIISPPTATPIPTSTPITSIQKNISLSIAKSEDSITKTNLALIKITITNESTARYKIQEQLINKNLPNYAIGETNSVEGELFIDTINNSIHKKSTIKVDLIKKYTMIMILEINLFKRKNNL